MPSSYTGNPAGAGVTGVRVAPTANLPADGDAGAAATFQPSLKDIMDEIAALKQKVALLDMSGETLPVISTGVKDILNKLAFAKAGAQIQWNTGVIAVPSGWNITAAAVNGTGIRVTIATGFTSVNDYYAFACQDFLGRGIQVVQHSATQIDLQPFDTTTGAAINVSGAFNGVIDLVVFGRQ